MAGVAPPPTTFPLRPARARGSAPPSGAAGADPGARRRGPADPGALARAVMRPWGIRPGALAAALMPEGRIPTSMIAEGLGPLFGSAWPADALWVNAVRLGDGRRVTFGRHPNPTPSLGQAVAASCAIPGFFEPVTIHGDRYVDGGVHSPTNLDLLAGLGLDLVIVSSPMSTAGRGVSLSTGFAIRRACRALLDAEAIRVRRRGTPVVAFQPTAADQAVMGVNAMDPRRRAAVTEAVTASTRRRLEMPDVKRRLAALAP